MTADDAPTAMPERVLEVLPADMGEVTEAAVVGEPDAAPTARKPASRPRRPRKPKAAVDAA